jgi:ribosome-binding factor A
LKQNSSSRKLNKQAQEIIASIISNRISDPRLGLVTVTGCEVSIDRSLCRVYVSAAPDSYDDVLAGLESARGRIRSLFGKAIDWRVTPELDFRIDTSADQAMRITEALKNVPPTMGVEKDEFGYPIEFGDGAGSANDEADGSDASQPSDDEREDTDDVEQ